MKYPHLLLLCLSLSVALLISCNGSDDDNGSMMNTDPDFIQNLTLSLTPTTGGQPFNLTYFDEDGSGGAAPIISSEQLPIQTTFSATLTMLDANGNAFNLEREDTQVFFSVSGGLDMSIAYNDMDANGNPVGFSTQITTGELPTTGSFNVVVKTMVNKPNTGIAGSTAGEVEVDFSFNVSTL